MHCPFCRHPDSRVVDSRTTDDGTSIRRRRQCPDCSRRFTTVETCSLMVIKRSGVTEPFSRTKVISGVRKACQGRPVTEDALAQLGQRVEEAVRATGSAELTTHDVGLAILGPLQELDLVAYLRFASVYRAFDSLEDFEAAIAELARAAASPRRASRGTAATDRWRSPRPPPPPTDRRPARRGRRPAAGGTKTCSGRRARRPQHQTQHRATGRSWALQGVFARIGRRHDRDGERPGTRFPRQGEPRRSKGLRIERIHTTPGVHPYDEVVWERRDVVMTNWRDGSINFEQRGVEFPDFWSVNAVNIVTSKYFRGAVGTPQRESEPEAAHRPDREDVPEGRRGLRLLRLARRRRDLRARADVRPPAPDLQLQLARSGSTSARPSRSRSPPASSCPSTTPWSRSSTGTRKRA